MDIDARCRAALLVLEPERGARNSFGRGVEVAGVQRVRVARPEHDRGERDLERVVGHRDLAGVHFTGSTEVFNDMWKTMGASMSTYRSYPRVVGETGGKDFILAHSSADVDALAVAIVRGGFEFQGQKCSAASRVYVPSSLWKAVRDRAVAMIDDIRTREPDAVFRSSFIVGFPGETESDHDALLGFLADVRLDWAGFFSFSREDGTAAATMDGTVPDALVRERLRECDELQDPITAASRMALVGETVDVLVDGTDDDGALVLEDGAQRHRVLAGEVV